MGDLPGCHTYSGTLLAAGATLTPASQIGTNAKKGSIKNDGSGGINLQLKCKGSTKLSNSHLLNNNEAFDIDGLDISEIKLIHTGTNANYRIFVSR